MPLFTLKDYQIQTLAVLRRFLSKSVEFGRVSTAFIDQTNRKDI